MKIIGFNGPPRSGKDTLAKHIHIIDSDEYRFIEGEARYNSANGAPFPWGHPERIESRACILPVRHVAFNLLGRPYDQATYDSIKDQPQPTFNGESIRTFMIRLMEEHIKPRYGKDFAVRSMMSDVASTSQINNSELLFLVTDIGFQEEVEYLESLVGYESFCLVRLYREGTDFSGDSRSYVSAMQALDFHNCMNPEDGAKRIMDRIHSEFGWQF